jgi:hypothetical protein
MFYGARFPDMYLARFSVSLKDASYRVCSRETSGPLAVCLLDSLACPITSAVATPLTTRCTRQAERKISVYFMSQHSIRLPCQQFSVVQFVIITPR